MSATVVAIVLLATGCAGGADDPAPETSPTTSATTSPSTSPSTPAPKPGTVPPPWLGTRELPTTADGFGEIRPTPPELRRRQFTLTDSVDPLPGDGFASKVTNPAPDRVLDRSTWVEGCPVDRDELAWIRVTFVGFDDERHTGELLVNARVADDVVDVFEQLYEARFPLEEMRITSRSELDAPPTGDGNNTSAFACRPVRGESTFSQHAYGLAIDVNPFQNPYVKGDLVLPELASAYTDRTRNAPGMIKAGGPVVDAFASIGWGWGGAWSSLKDIQHFSENNR